MRKKGYIMFLLLAVLMLILYVSYNVNDKIYVDKGKSYFSEFKVENDKVFIECYITLVNTFDVEKTVNLSAKLPEDVTTGLLKNEDVISLNEDGSKTEFILSSNSSESFDVVFVGAYSGANQKHDRGLPEINISIVK